MNNICRRQGPEKVFISGMKIRVLGVEYPVDILGHECIRSKVSNHKKTTNAQIDEVKPPKTKEEKRVNEDR